MPITLRSVKGSELTHEELDGNFEQLVTDISGKAASGHTHTDLHTHANKAVLDKISEAAGAPTWNGAAWPSGGGADPEGWALISDTAWSTPLGAVEFSVNFAAYRQIRVIADAQHPATGGYGAALHASIDGGATWITSGYYLGFYTTSAGESASSNYLTSWNSLLPDDPIKVGSAYALDLLFRSYYAPGDTAPGHVLAMTGEMSYNANSGISRRTKYSRLAASTLSANPVNKLRVTSAAPAQPHLEKGRVIVLGRSVL